MDTNTTCFFEEGIGLAMGIAILIIPVGFFFCGSFAYILKHKFSTKCGAVLTIIASFFLGVFEMVENKHFVHGFILLIPITICIIIAILLREKIMDFFESGANESFEEKITEDIKEFIRGFKMGIRKK